MEQKREVFNALRNKSEAKTRAGNPVVAKQLEGAKPAMALIKELTQRRNETYIHVAKKGFSLTLSRY